MSNTDPSGPKGTARTDTPDTIVVDPTPTPATIATLLRYGIAAVAAILSALGWIGAAGKASALLLAVGPIAVAISAGWGAYLSWRNARQKATMAASLPNAIARTK